MKRNTFKIIWSNHIENEQFDFPLQIEQWLFSQKYIALYKFYSRDGSKKLKLQFAA